MGIACYLALILGVFGGCWVVEGGPTTSLLFVTVHGGCATAVLLLYVRELSFCHVTEARSVETATATRKLHS